jgi:hypothetical protein
MDVKKISRSVISGLLATIAVVFLSTNGYLPLGSGSSAAAVVPASPTIALRAAAEALSAPTVRVRAASGANIRFRPQDGRSGDPISPRGRDIPHLVLHRNGALTNPDERTLIVKVTGIDVPPPGVTVTLSVETQHGDPDPVEESASEQVKEPRLSFRARGSERRITVWREAQWIANASSTTQTGVTVAFEHTFGETVISGAGTIPTPTDYFHYDVAVIAQGQLAADALPISGGDHAFLMENQWIAPLPQVWEASPGAAPDELIVYYADTFPFQKNTRDPATWVAREDVPGYVHIELIPRMVEAFRIQADEWEFPWYPAWTSYRSGPDRERLSVALSDGRTWFHGKAPLRGHAGISINTAARDNAAYDTLTDALMSNFHHELFHNHQRNINQHYGGNRDLGGTEDAWRFFSEGTGVLASSVGQPNLQFRWMTRAYVARANSYIGDGGPLSDLDRSYEGIYPYNAAIYWRFLYEQCGTALDGSLDPAAGMQVVRRALTILYSGKVVDVTASTDLIGALPGIMDRALAASPCPFDTHAETLAAFARALYALRLEGGRCAGPDSPAGCGFYDPHEVYRDPPVKTVIYSGEDQQHAGEIPSSFGLDFVNVTLSQDADGQPVKVEFHPAPGAVSAFTVQVLELEYPEEGRRPRVVSTQRAGQRTLVTTASDGALSYTIPAVDTTEYDALGLVIARVDAEERLDPVGEYTIVLRPAESDAQLVALSSR